jgi:hypothetical protein
VHFSQTGEDRTGYNSSSGYLSDWHWLSTWSIKNVLLAVVGQAIDSATGLQLQQATAYTLPGQYPIYTPTAIYSHLPTTTLIPSTLASPNKESEYKEKDANK